MVKSVPPIEVNLDSLKKVEDKILGRKKKVKAKDAAVKVSAELLARVEEFINLEENKFRYANRKQFIDLAVFEKLKRGK
jgi:hypothetical protein